MNNETEKNVNSLSNMNIGYPQGEDVYDDCARYPNHGQILWGEHGIEPFDSLYGRFLQFDIGAYYEVERRAKDTWDSIVYFVDSTLTAEEQTSPEYRIYVLLVKQFKCFVENSNHVEYSDLLNKFFLEIDRQQKLTECTCPDTESADQ